MRFEVGNNCKPVVALHNRQGFGYVSTGAAAEPSQVGSFCENGYLVCAQRHLSNKVQATPRTGLAKAHEWCLAARFLFFNCPEHMKLREVVVPIVCIIQARNTQLGLPACHVARYFSLKIPRFFLTP